MSERRFITPQRAFVRALRAGVASEATTDEALIEEARRVWSETQNFAFLLHALGTLEDRRELARGACAVVRFALAPLALETPLQRTHVLDTAEAWVASRDVSDESMARLVAVANGPALLGPRGARGAMEMALWSVANVLDPDERAPELAAVSAVELSADAWFEHGLVDHQDRARRTFADEIRRTVRPWAALAAATKPFELPADEANDIPF